MFCPNCGTEQLKGATFCNICGGELPKLPESSENETNLHLPNTNINNNKAQFIQNMDIPNQYPNQMPNMGMPMQYPNQMPNMGMPNQYPNQMPNMGMPNQQININITHEPPQSSKNKYLAALLAFFFGGFGLHKFYLGKPGLGFLYLLICWTGIPYFVALIESIMYLCTSNDDWNRKY